jgi:hypothetical protein
MLPNESLCLGWNLQSPRGTKQGPHFAPQHADVASLTRGVAVHHGECDAGDDDGRPGRPPRVCVEQPTEATPGGEGHGMEGRRPRLPRRAALAQQVLGHCAKMLVPFAQTQA